MLLCQRFKQHFGMRAPLCKGWWRLCPWRCVDAIQKFKLMANTYDASMGRAGEGAGYDL
jgi:hypothetical protein